jgi:hypothetical protein
MLYITNATGSEKKPYNKDDVFKTLFLPVINRTNVHLDPELLDQYLFELKGKLNAIPNICKKKGVEVISKRDLMHRLVMILKILTNRNKKIGSAILNMFQIYHNISFKDIPTREQDTLLLLHK